MKQYYQRTTALEVTSYDVVNPIASYPFHSYEVSICAPKVKVNVLETGMSVPARSQIRPGIRVSIVLKEHQRSGTLTEGVVKDILTKSSTHPHGIKVRLQSGLVGRVKVILEEISHNG